LNRKKDFNNKGVWFSLMLTLVLTGACTTPAKRLQPDADATACYIIYDAGSSATRLFIYQETASGWVMHKGPETGALSDPVRRNRGKSMSDANEVIADILIALDDMRRDGPPDNDGSPQWLAFDWHSRCIISGAAVYATAGMRLAEQQDARNSGLLWNRLNNRLSKKLGIEVTTRTLSEYEEGLYAWLTLRELNVDGNFGVAEMGGASFQVTFNCPFCVNARPVRVKGEVIPVFSHSFLGWGQDEAWRKYRNLGACSRGAGLKYADWQLEDCAGALVEFKDTAADVSSMIKGSTGFHWYLSSAFRYMQDTDIDNFCRKGVNSGFEPESSCFRAVYLDNVIDTLGLPKDSQKTTANWTLGAVVCAVTRCLDTQ
jgi:hypothetical protein